MACGNGADRADTSSSGRSGDSTPSVTHESRCAPLTLDDAAPRVRSDLGARSLMDRLNPAPPSALIERVDRWFAVDTLDLDCDGRFDIAASFAAAAEDARVFEVHVQRASGWEQALSTRTDQPVTLIAAADLSRTGRRDVV